MPMLDFCGPYGAGGGGLREGGVGGGGQSQIALGKHIFRGSVHSVFFVCREVPLSCWSQSELQKLGAEVSRTRRLSPSRGLAHWIDLQFTAGYIL